jgi:hypothetical protein
MDFSEKMNVIRTVLGDSYMVFDRFDALDNSYTLYIDRKLTDWHLKMRFTSGELMRMGDSFVGAVCRRVVSEYSNFITRGAPE